MLTPRKVKYRKSHKGRNRGKLIASSKVSLNFGKFGLKSEEHAWISSRQIEAARRAMTRFIKKGGKIWIRIFPDKPVTSKGSQSTMGSGKGALDHYVAVVRPGTILFEMDGVPEDIARKSLRLASYKFGVKSRIVIKE